MNLGNLEKNENENEEVFTWLTRILLIIESFLLDHGEVALPALSLTAVVVAHGSRHLLVVHLLRPVGLHLTPRPGELYCAARILSLVGLATNYPK